jgi:DNA-binding FadR family transcriptional regulator
MTETANTLTEQIANDILAKAAQMHLKPGDKLHSEAELGIAFHASRSAIREALKLLAGRGVIQIINGKGAILRPPNEHQLQLYFDHSLKIGRTPFHEIMEARKPIEIQSAMLAAERRTRTHIEHLEALIKQMRAQLHNTDRYVDLDLELHLLIAHAGQNSVVNHLIRAIRGALNTRVHDSLYKRRNRQQLEIVQTLHEDIVYEIVAGHPDRAGQAMRLHFDEALTFLNRQAGETRKS